MSISEDLINFDLIETHKENILQLPGGRSARQLASVLSPLSSARSGASPTLDETKTLNDAIRQEYEIELRSIADSDDPLDIYDRYVKWTLNAYPSAQATPQSQLLPLLERATKAFLTSSHYKNDPRYLKLWLHYIRLFSDAPRETFAYLARHNVGEGLGLFYEEFAAWLEGAGRWTQADEVYTLGIEREARPAERLMRKYTQFQQRYAVHPQHASEPSSPALPTVRPALAAKIDPFASTPRSDDPQTARPRVAATNPRSGKPKMAIFSDGDNETPPPPAAVPAPTIGWDSIGSIRDRKKENTTEARPWTGEVLKAGKKVGSAPKMEIFKDPTLRSNESKSNKSSSKLASSAASAVNPRTGRSERVFVNLEAVYPAGQEEYSFEELRARTRGWMDKDWCRKSSSPLQSVSDNIQRWPAKENTSPSKEDSSPAKENTDEILNVENLSQQFLSQTTIDDTSSQPVEPSYGQGIKPPKQKRIKVREIKQETQTVKTRLESPTGPKSSMRRKNSAEPTMTFHSKAATDEIYNIFNQPLKSEQRDDTQSGDDTTDFGDETDYSTAGDSTGRISNPTSEYGGDDDRDQETMGSVRGGQNTGSCKQAAESSVSPWSDFTASKHLPKPHNKAKARQTESEDLSEQDIMTSSLNQTQTTGAFDTQAIAAIAAADFGEMDTMAIAKIASGADHRFDEGDEDEEEEEQEQEQVQVEDDLGTPVESEQVEIPHKPRYVPLPPEDYEPTPLRPFRDPVAVAQNRLPFMTPINERTESSLAPSTVFAEQEYFTSKTPSRGPGSNFESPSKLQVDALLLSSPPGGSPQSATRKRLLPGPVENDLELLDSSLQKKKCVPPPKAKQETIPFLVSKPSTTSITTNGTFEVSIAPTSKSNSHSQGPIIRDLQCNPCLTSIRAQILSSISPPLLSQPGYHDNTPTEYKQYAKLSSYAKQLATTKVKASPRKTQNERTLTKVQPPMLSFTGTSRVYAVKKLLGKGAFAPVYLVDSYDADGDSSQDVPIQSGYSSDVARGSLEALKTDHPPQNAAWEFHILTLLRRRLGRASRTMQSIVLARECHVFADEAYLVLDYHNQGTLLDLVNQWKEDSKKRGEGKGEGVGVDEVLACWIGTELLGTLDEIHKVGILHGDLKADNCLVRFSPDEVTGPYDPEGKDGWSAKGLTLIDFGRGIDMRAFEPRASFVADWEVDGRDCVEMREARPWKRQIDYFGAAGVLHSTLFGKYIDTVQVAGESGLGKKKEYKVRESFKRYWNAAMWGDVFGCLVNSGVVMAEQGGEEGMRKELKRVTARMQRWLVDEGENTRDGRSLRRCLKRAEGLACARK